jgi:transposase
MMDEPKARIVEARRDPVELRVVDLDSLLAPEHPARTVWAFVQGLDLAPLYARIKAVEGHAGRPAGDPRVFMALWLYATLDGVGSARALERLSGEHHAYRWICGGVAVNCHTLADFRVAHAQFLGDLLTRGVAALMLNGTVTLNRVAQDGVRVRAGAGSGSFSGTPWPTTCVAWPTSLPPPCPPDPQHSRHVRQAGPRRPPHRGAHPFPRFRPCRSRFPLGLRLDLLIPSQALTPPAGAGCPFSANGRGPSRVRS